MNKELLLLKTYFGFTSMINPEKAAKKSFKLFQLVSKKQIREREEHFFELSRHFKIQGKKENIDCFELGDPNGQLVFLVHGWESNAGSMSMIAHSLAKKGKRVITFNLPGHAFSKSKFTNLLECKDAFQDVVSFLNPKEDFSVVAHSFGSAVTTYALSKSNYAIDKLVLLTNPNKVETIFREFKKGIGLGNKAYKKLIHLSTERLGEPLSNISVEKNLQKINYKKLVLIHDKNDQVLRYHHSLEVNNSIENAQLITMENIGHYKMLWNKEVIHRVAGIIEGKEVF